MGSLTQQRASRAGYAVTLLFIALFASPLAWTAPEDPEEGGQWSGVTNWPMIPVSGANLPDGRIVAWASNERTSFPSGPEFTYTAVWDPQTNSFTEIPHTSHDMFCSHHVMMEDGKVFVSGGRNQGNSPWTSTFNYETNQWEVLPNMNRGRWYPTSVALSDGTIMTTIGSGGGDTAELWDGSNQWNELTALDFDEPILDYTGHGERNWWPLLHLAPDGRVFHSGPTPDMHYIDTTGQGSITQVATMNTWYPKHGTTVMYEQGKLLTAGGWTNGGTLASSNKAMTIDLNGTAPVITQIGNMNVARKFHNGVTLPNGEVLVIGGNTSGKKFNDSGSVYSVEIWNPTTQQFRLGASMATPRNYHSIALLMVDGRVLSAGGGLCNCAADHQDSEIYTPPYLFDNNGNPASRPVITRAPGVVQTGQTISVSGTANLAEFSLIKMSSTTHGVNSDLRYLAAPHTESSAGEYNITLNSNSNVLTPGYWMLFALNSQGTPSVAKILQVSTQGLQSGPPTIKQMGDVTNSVEDHVALHVIASDPNGDTLAFSATGLPTGLSINPASGVVHGIPGASGSYTTTITVNDNNQGTATTTFNWTINSGNAASNTSPVLTNPGSRSDDIGVAVELVLQAFDADADVLTFSATNLPTGLSLNAATGVITGTPTAAGSFATQLHVTDGNQTNSASLTWTIVPENQPPVVTNPGTQNATAGDAVSLAIQATDPNGDTLTFSASNLPTGLTINSSTGLITGSPTTAGTYNSQVTASDAEFSDSATFVWNIAVQNFAPVLTSPGNQSNFEGDSVNLTITATDANNDPLTYSATGLPTGLNINATTGVISGITTTAGNYSTTLSVSDGLLSDSATVSWNVDTPPDPIVISPLSATPIEENTSANYTANATGEPTLEYSWTFGDGSSATPFSTNNSISHTFTESGHYLVTVTVRNGFDQDTETFTQAVHEPLTAAAPSQDSTILFESVTGLERVWNVNPDNDSVTVVNAQTLAKIAEIAVPQQPTSLALSPSGEVWVVSKAAAMVTRLNTTTLAQSGNQAFTSGNAPHALVFNPQGNAAYLSQEAIEEITVLNASTAAPVSSIAVGPDVRHLAVTADGATLLATRFITPPLPGEDGAAPNVSGGGEVLFINTANEQISQTLQLAHSNASVSEHSGPGLPNYLRAPAISPDGTQAWVPSKQDNVLAGTLRNGNGLDHDHTVRAITSHIDLASNTADVADRMDHDNASIARAAAFGKFGAYLFVALEGNRMIAAIDAYRGEEMFRFPAGRAPAGLVMADDGVTLFVHNYLDRSVTAHDVSALINAGDIMQTTLGTVSLVAAENLAANVLLGKQHFFDALDPRLALESYMSCASCHADGDDDGRVWDFTGFGEGVRNTTTLVGQAGTGNGPVHWTGNFDEIQDFEGQIRSFAGGLGLMSNTDFNTGTRSQPLGDPKAGLSPDLDALAAYLESLSGVGASPHKVNGNLTAQAEVGKNLFADEGCGSCHSGNNFTDSAPNVRHDIGTLTSASGQRLGATLDGLDTPTLKGLWLTAPYLHNGSAATIEDAIAAHTSISLTSPERADLAAYLMQVDDAETPPGPNSAPVLTNPGNQSQTEGDSVLLSLSATDADGDPITYTATGYPPGVSFAGGTFTGTLTTAGTYTVSATAADGRGGQDTESFSWSVQTNNTNNPPSLTAPSNQTGSLNNPASLQLVGSDPDNDPLTYSASGLPTGLGINASSGLISGTPTATGSFTVTASVSDGQTSDSANFTWVITGSASTQTLVVSVASSEDDAEERSTGYMRLTSSDLELSTDNTDVQWIGMRFANITIPQGSTITSAYVQFQTDEISTQSTNLTVYLQDAGNAASFSTSRYDVTSRSRTGSVSWQPAPWDTVGEAATDQQTPDLSGALESVVGRSDWSDGNAVVVLVTGTGRRTAESFNGSAPPSLHIEYESITGGNTAPTISSPGNQSGNVGATVDLAIQASDADSDPLTFTATGLPNDLGINSNTGEISGTLNVAGVFPVTVQVSDGSASRGTSFTWTVTSSSGNAVQTQVNATDNDAEEKPTGSISLTSSDLELTTDGSQVQTVGMRFTGVTIPQNAIITNAYVQFQTDEVSTGTSNLVVRAQAAGNAPSFTANSFDLTNRALTSAQVNWAPDPWQNAGEAGLNQRTPDLSTVVDAVTSRSDWQNGNALVVVVTGSGRRTAESFNGDSSGAPKLFVEYSTNTGGNTAPVVTNPGAQTHTVGDFVSLTVNASDSDNDPLTFSANGLPGALSINSATGEIAGTLSAAGTFSVTVTVNDGQANTSVSFAWTVNSNSGNVVEVRIQSTNDDAEERVATGAVLTASSDLELIDDSAEQVVGMRFTALAIPQGATVTNAYIQFKVDEVRTPATNVVLKAQNTGDADAFAAVTNNLSSRPTTTAQVAWNIPFWANAGDAGADQQTPNIAAVVQEVVNRADWVSGNNLVILVTGTGRRTAESYNGDASGAPLLHVEFN